MPSERSARVSHRRFLRNRSVKRSLRTSRTKAQRALASGDLDAAQQAVHFLGMPEARLPLAEATVYLARAPKSNSAYAAYQRAAQDAECTRNEPVPLHLRNAATRLMRDLGYGSGYQYAHDYEGHTPPSQTHRPPPAEGNTYYVPGELGDEAEQ